MNYFMTACKNYDVEYKTIIIGESRVGMYINDVFKNRIESNWQVLWFVFNVFKVKLQS